MDGKLIVSSSPHISSPVKTKNIMLDVIIALIPSLAASIYFFGPRAAVITIVSVATCVIAEYICRKVMKREQTIGDLSAVVTGILLAFNLPSRCTDLCSDHRRSGSYCYGKTDVWWSWSELC